MDLVDNHSGSGWIKIDLLSHGIEIDGSVFNFLRAHPHTALRKNFYNTPLWIEASGSIPQELRLLGLVVGLNSYGFSSWRLKWLPKEDCLCLENTIAQECFRAELIPDLNLFSCDSEAIRLANLYGGAALAFFSPRSCYFFGDGTECTFCSLAGTAKETASFKDTLLEDEVRATVRKALETDADRIEQVMIVGGNMRDLDRGFRHHVSLATAAAREIAAANLSSTVSVHIATMPPHDLELLHLLSELPNVHVMFNLEVWSPKKFAEICRGKDQDYGRSKMLRALELLRDTIGPYRAHSLLVTGIESPESTGEGATALAEMGVSPIINLYHSDRHSRLGLSVRPRFADLAPVARVLQDLYASFPILPYWKSCGRNAIDAEAKRGLFLQPVPAFLQMSSDG